MYEYVLFSMEMGGVISGEVTSNDHLLVITRTLKFV